MLAKLYAADMSVENLVKATTYLAGCKYSKENRDLRDKILNGHAFALGVVQAAMFEEGWQLGIDPEALILANLDTRNTTSANKVLLYLTGLRENLFQRQSGKVDSSVC